MSSMTETSPDLQHRHPIFRDIQLGIGTWAWGDRLMWGYGKDYQDEDLYSAFELLVNSGIRFFDTAEVYGLGRSETLLGSFIRQMKEPVTVATKFMPFPWRLSRRSLYRALRFSLRRLGLPQVGLYQTHFHLRPIAIETWMEAMVDMVHQGLTLAVGVSNYDREQMQRAYDFLAQEGIQLASNQVEYHLLNRKIEKNGLLKHCQDLGVTVLAYSPLAMGILSGKYTPENPPKGMRNARYNPAYLAKCQPLFEKMRQIGTAHAGKSPAQVALNWVICKGAIPIPGVKNVQQAEQNLQAIGWRLSQEEIEILDTLSDQLQV